MSSAGILVLVIILSIIFVPHISIWAVNTLFAIEIAHTFTNWFAALILLAIVGR